MVAGLDVRLDEAGRFSLNDLHRTGGSKPKHRPSMWLANQQPKGTRYLAPDGGVYTKP